MSLVCQPLFRLAYKLRRDIGFDLARDLG